MRFSQTLAAIILSISVSAQCPNLIWADEFDGESLNTDNWTFQLGDGCDLGICGWGNGEQQFYQQENVTVSDGMLRIVARQQAAGGLPYTSGRINTRDKQDFRYGYFEARIKVPPGRGLWPAFWMLPTDEVYGFWPQSGEIDIMEWVGRKPETVLGTIHYGQPFPNNSFSGEELDLTNAAWSDNFHTYAVEWQEGIISWYVDGYRYGFRTPASLNGENWPFDQDFHFLLNVAVGGTLGGAISNAALPATMEVDYVRVYDTRPVGFRGPREADAGDTYTYVIENLPEGGSVTYSAPEGATVTPDPDNPAVFRVTFGNTTGVVSATITDECGTSTVGTQVRVIPKLTRAFSFENFDDQEQIEFAFSTGSLTEVNNPEPDELNASNLTGRYVRQTNNQFDVLIYDVSTIDNADDYVAGEQAFVIDLYTSAPPGTELLLQLETNAAMPENFPAGRHSRFQVFTTKQNEWERLTFNLVDRPDPLAPGNRVEQLVLLFEPNTMTALTCFWDNFDSYTLAPVSNNSREQLTFPLSANPTPARSIVSLAFSLPQAAVYDLSVFDLAGKRVLYTPGIRGVAGQQTRELHLSTLPQGVYLAQLSFADGIRTVKVVRQ